MRVRDFSIVVLVSVYVYSCIVTNTDRSCDPEKNDCPTGQYCSSEGICKEEINDIVVEDVFQKGLDVNDIKLDDFIAYDIVSDVLSDQGLNECIDNCSETCKPNKICRNGKCVDYETCFVNDDCPCGWHCNSFESRCEECASDEDCKNRTDGKTKCDIGKTFLCIEPPVCNPACDPNCQVCKDGNCVLAPNKCCQNSDCPSNNCVNYQCEQGHTCSDVCSTDQECKDWCKDSNYICYNNMCLPKRCDIDRDCDPLCGTELGKCNSGFCECLQQCQGRGVMCNACNDDCDCDTTSGFTCYEFTNPMTGETYKGCTHACAAKTDCEAPAIMCLAGGGKFCTCMSVQ